MRSILVVTLILVGIFALAACEDNHYNVTATDSNVNFGDSGGDIQQSGDEEEVEVVPPVIVNNN